MKSLCIKTNNSEIIHYLLEKFACFNMENVFFRENQFCYYKNIIIHYTGHYEDEFINHLGNILTECVLTFYEEKLLHKNLRYNYFYFDEEEQSEILKLTQNILTDYESNSQRNSLILPEISKYISEHHNLNLTGFVHFRLKEYLSLLDKVIDEAVNKYIIEKEYSEFIHLLKMYIDSQIPTVSFLHLIYLNGESILLDESRRPIPLNNNSIKAKYLSDISFSSNDYALNTLLNMLPRHLEVHLIDQSDEFITTLQSIFENRIHICKDCSICTTYKRFKHVTI